MPGSPICPRMVLNRPRVEQKSRTNAQITTREMKCGI